MKLSAEYRPPSMAVTIRAPVVGISTGDPIAREYVDRDPYKGDYTINPSTEEQILSTKNLWMTDNITVGAIPQNYGLITWNGSTLTVS